MPKSFRELKKERLARQNKEAREQKFSGFYFWRHTMDMLNLWPDSTKKKWEERDLEERM